MYDVIVVGTRAAGASTAMLLARRGMSVLAVDRARFPSDTLSTHQVQVPGVACLRRWGLLDKVAAITPPTRQVKLDAGGVILEGSFPPCDRESALYSPRRTTLDALLVDAAHAAGAEVRENFRVEELAWVDGRVVGILGRSGTGATVTSKANLVVGADGKHSMIADTVQAPCYRRHAATTVASYSYWSGVGLSAGELYQRPGCAAAAFPTNDNLIMAYVATPIADFTEWRNDIERHYLETLDRCGDLGERLRCGHRVERIRTTPDLPNHVRVPCGPGWALVGDAGLVMDPVSAQGIGNGFVQAEWLAAALTAGLGGTRPLAACLADYQRRRDAAMLPMYDFTLRLGSLTPDPAMQILLGSLVGRPAEINRLLGVFAGIVPIQSYFSARNLVRLLGVRRTARAVIAARTRPRPGSAGNGVVDATDELGQRDGIVRISS
jgi:2-polyprenyl-6-methoxyphenol hydroxylase-like FAD-dependent oxidoreductase